MKKAEVFVSFAIILVFWKLFVPTPFVSGDFQIIYPENLKIGFNLPQAWVSRWAEGLGEYSVGTLWSWPLDFLFGLGGFLGIDFWILERILGIFPAILFSFWSMGQLLKTFGILGWGNLVGRLFYTLNSYFLLLLDGGQLNLALAYSILPFVFVLFKKAMTQGNLREIVKFSLGTVLVSIFDFRIIFILFILIAADSLFHFKIQSYYKRLFRVGFVAVLLLTLLNAYWILPSFLNQTPTLPTTYNRLDQLVKLSFANIGHVLFLVQPHWYKNIFGQVTALSWEFVFIPLLVFLAPVLRRDKKVAFWLLIALIGIFLTKGANPPLDKLNLWLFANMPGFSLFRDPTKFFFLICLGYAVLLSISVSEISKRAWFKLMPIIVIIYLLWLVKPVYFSELNGILGDQSFQTEYSDLANFLRADQKFSRVFWIPTKPPLGLATPQHLAVEAARFAQKRPFATGTIGTYETFNFLREAIFAEQLMDVAGVGWIVYPYPDPKRDDLSADKIRYYYTFSQQLSNLEWLKKEEAIQIPTFKVKDHQDEIFVVPHIWWVVGSDDLYKDFAGGNKPSLSKNGLIFAEEYAGLGESLQELPEAKIILNKKDLLDLAAGFIRPEFLISPADTLDFSPDSSGWWKREAADLVWWRSFLQEKYGIENQDFDLGMGWAVGEGNLKLKIKNEKLKINKILLARVMESSRSGELKFYQGNQLIGEVSTKVDGEANVRWFEVGQIPGDGGQFSIKSAGDINVVNALAILNKDLWESFKISAENFKKEGRIKELSSEKSPEEINISFKQLNPITYQVNVANLTKPALLILSQSFNRLWKLDSQYSVPVYSLLNGFRIDKDGQYQIEFEPQQNVERGFAMSLLSMIFLIGYLLTRQKRKS